MEVRPGEYAVKRPTNPRTKAFHRYQEWLLKQLAQEISIRAIYDRDEDWLGAALQPVAQIDPDITDDMVREAMRLAINENRQNIVWHEAWVAETRNATDRMEHAENEPRCVEVVASPEIAALLLSGPPVPPEVGSPAVVLQFKLRRIAE